MITKIFMLSEGSSLSKGLSVLDVLLNIEA